MTITAATNTDDTVLHAGPPNDTQETAARFINSQPILDMMTFLAQTGRDNFARPGVWETCLCAIILQLEPGCKVRRILEALPSKTGGLDEVDVLNVMAHMGYFCRPAECDMMDIDDRLLPGLFIPASGDPCIILGRNAAGKLQFYDPVSSLISLVPPSLGRNGRVWFFQVYDENRPALSKFMRKGTGHGWFRALTGRFRGTVTQVMVTGFFLNGMALLTPLYIMLVYDRVIAANAPDILPMLAVGAAVAIAFEWRLRAIRSQGLSWLAGRLDNVVANKIFSHLIGLSPDMIEKASVSAQIARIKTFESVRDFFAGSVFLSLLEMPFVIVSVIAIAVIAGPLVLIPLLMAAGYMVIFMALRRQVKTHIRLAAKSSSARQQFVIEAFEKISDIRIHGLNAKWQEKFRHLSGREMLSHFHLAWLGMVAETLAHALTILSAVATVGCGVYLIWEGHINTGALVATMILVWRILTPFYSLCAMIPRLEQLRNSIIQVNSLMDLDTEAEEGRSYSRLSRINGKISFRHVAFRYTEESDTVFSNLSFDAAAGDVVAITGANGTGKGSVLKLLKSFYRPHEGSIHIDGFDIRQLDARDLRRQIAYIPSVPHFYEGSVAYNLRLANPLARDADIARALDMADATGDVDKLPGGLRTVINGRDGMLLTQSLATKLSLARGYLNPGNILLIDELPNSILTGKAGANLKEYLLNGKGRRTVLMVTYRDDFMKIADVIVCLRGDEPPVCGPRDEMLASIHMPSQGAAV